jgi:hypothetical protein
MLVLQKATRLVIATVLLLDKATRRRERSEENSPTQAPKRRESARSAALKEACKQAQSHPEPRLQHPWPCCQEKSTIHLVTIFD